MSENQTPIAKLAESVFVAAGKAVEICRTSKIPATEIAAVIAELVERELAQLKTEITLLEIERRQAEHRLVAAKESIEMGSQNAQWFKNQIANALTEAGAPTHHPDIGAAARKPMMPQERIAWLKEAKEKAEKACAELIYEFLSLSEYWNGGIDSTAVDAAEHAREVALNVLAKQNLGHDYIPRSELDEVKKKLEQLKGLMQLVVPILTILAHKDCEQPVKVGEDIVTREMASDAGDPSMAGSVVNEHWERCGSCLTCIADQLQPNLAAILNKK